MGHGARKGSPGGHDMCVYVCVHFSLYIRACSKGPGGEEPAGGRN